MLTSLRSATVLLFCLTLLTGVAYPAAVTLLAQGLFPHQSNGSLIHDDQGVRGSQLVGQNFTRTEYFWGRLSATGPMPYHAGSSSGSNRGPLHPDLTSAAADRMAALRQGPVPAGPVPVDLVTASGSGLDPHISPAAAAYQVPRVAAARTMSEADVRQLVLRHTSGRQWGILGEPRVNVLELNRALDARASELMP